MKFLDDLGNDQPDRVGGHREHEKHQVGKPADRANASCGCATVEVRHIFLRAHAWFVKQALCIPHSLGSRNRLHCGV